MTLLVLRNLFRPLRKRSFNTRKIPPQQSESARLFQLTALLLQTQVQTFLSQVASLGQQLVRAQLREFFHFHNQAARTRWRVKNFVRTGSLSAARRSDSRATDSGTPSISNKIFPGRTVATQYSG
jgi:hypothetical protein